MDRCGDNCNQSLRRNTKKYNRWTRDVVHAIRKTGGVGFIFDILYNHQLYSRAYSTRFATISVVNTLEKGLNIYER